KACPFAEEYARNTPIWQFSIRPAVPEYIRATEDEGLFISIRGLAQLDLDSLMNGVPVCCEQLLFEFLQVRLGRADDVSTPFFLEKFDVLFRDHPPVHDPDAVALSI